MEGLMRTLRILQKPSVIDLPVVTTVGERKNTLIVYFNNTVIKMSIFKNLKLRLGQESQFL